MEKGIISESKIDESVFRLLRARFHLGKFADPDTIVWNKIPYSVVNSAGHQAKALEMARKSMTLLTNKNQILPLGKTLKKIAVVGPNAADSVMMWGNYNGTPSHTVTILEGIRDKVPQAEVVYEKGCDYVDDQVMYSFFDQCSLDGKKGMKATFWNNRDMEGEPVVVQQFADPLRLNTAGGTPFAAGVELHDISARFETLFVPDRSGEVTFYLSADDGCRLSVGDESLISDWKNGPASEKCCKLTVEKGKIYPIQIDYYNAGGVGELAFDLGYKQQLDYQAVAGRVADADVILFAGGISPTLEGEEMPVDLPGFRKGDRTNIDLPKVQKEMLKALKQIGKPVIFVLCSGSAIALPQEVEHTDAILEAWYPGQAGGTAVADVLFGDYNPAGRLPVTFYASTDDLPDFEDYSMANRTYRYFKGTPLFPFGHGLSYTTFEYGNATLETTEIKAGKEVILTIPLQNTGKCDGDEVIQIYIRQLSDSEGPAKSLRAFRRVSVKAGKSATIQIQLPAHTFEFYDPETKAMAIRSGQYELLYGGTSDNNKLKRMTITLL